MKKLLSVLLALVLVAVMALPALAEETTVFELSGLVIDTSEEGILLDTTEFGEVMVLLDEYTKLDVPDQEAMIALEDVSDEDKAAIDDYLLLEQVNGVRVGDYIHVIYDGKMTRSLPPQVMATEIRCYVLIGQVIAQDELTAQEPVADGDEIADVDVEAEAASDETEAEPEADADAETDADVDTDADTDEPMAFLFQDALTGAQVLVRLPEDVEAAYEVGEQLIIYYNGVMTMSLPGQINPDLINVFELATDDAEPVNG